MELVVLAREQQQQTEPMGSGGVFMCFLSFPVMFRVWVFPVKTFREHFVCLWKLPLCLISVGQKHSPSRLRVSSLYPFSVL